jgi:hypothetical protein
VFCFNRLRVLLPLRAPAQHLLPPAGEDAVRAEVAGGITAHPNAEDAAAQRVLVPGSSSPDLSGYKRDVCRGREAC